jgi:predicted polyphosphate/ATP-dependent NAD kinase
LTGRGPSTRLAEVMDIDEEAFREGVVAARLTGYLRIPYRRQLVQSLKSATPAGEITAMRSIASQVVDGMDGPWLTILGPGTTTRAIAERLGLPKTLIGVDVVAGGEVIAVDANEADLMGLLSDGRPARIVVTPIGGQGYLFGRGNQQISSRVIEQVGVENVLVVSTPGKIHSLGGRPLWVDTGDPAVDEALKGYVRIVTGYREEIVYRVVC